MISLSYGTIAKFIGALLLGITNIMGGKYLKDRFINNKVVEFTVSESVKQDLVNKEGEQSSSSEKSEDGQSDTEGEQHSISQESEINDQEIKVVSFLEDSQLASEDEQSSISQESEVANQEIKIELSDETPQRKRRRSEVEILQADAVDYFNRIGYEEN